MFDAEKKSKKKDEAEPAEVEMSKQVKQSQKQESSFPRYTRLLWKGIVPVYQCGSCTRQEDDVDVMILHVVDHVVPEKREALLDKLIKEK